MCQSQSPNIPHRLAETRFDDTVAHADDKKEKEGERIPASIEYSDDNHQELCQRVVAMIIRIVWYCQSRKYPAIGRHTIESPCHQLFDYKEHNDCCDVVLNGHYVRSAAAILLIFMSRLTYVVAILNIKEAPEAVSCKSSCSTSVPLGFLPQQNGIDDSKPPIKGQLCNLSGLQLSVCIPKLDNGLVVFRRESIRANTVVSRPFNWVVDRLGVF